MSPPLTEYEQNIQTEKEGSLKASPTSEIGQTEVLTIKCKSCARKLFQVRHKIGDGQVFLDVQSFRFKAYCRPCLDSFFNGPEEEQEDQ